MKKILLILVLMALACAGPLRRGGRLADGPVPFQTILAGSHSLIDTSAVMLVKNESDWDKVWIQAKGRIDPLPERPTVDFSRQCVIAAFMGERPSSGFRIEISAIEKRGKILDLHIKKYETPGMLTVVTNPFYLVRLPKGDYELNVIEETIR
ncbi:MAG: protease complex subunit PrcB family protein [Candidatus Zixiibacteriota bacterium]|nr:MAG: protease complex subunit PrcB family protein [candidate division Zixibacteria bacterium]